MVESLITPESGEQAPGLYLHIPYCKSKCGYCSFNSYPCDMPPASYLEAIREQALFFAGQQWSRDRVFSTIFIGGGTPTIYGDDELAELLAFVRQRFQLSDNPEISIEGNPNSINGQSLAHMRRAGVNRLSIGVQAFSDRLLKGIGRAHSVAQAIEAISQAREAGFDNINLDLIYGLPGQSLADWRESLEMALEFVPEHLALYELSVEEGTPFAALQEAGKLVLPEDDELALMEEAAQEMLAGSDLVRYEISNYARPGRECRHNINYWQNGSYLGLGAGAVSCFSGLRVKNVADPEQFINLIAAGKSPCHDGECLPQAARFRESVIMGLRLLEGVSLNLLKEQYGLTPRDYYGKVLDDLLAQDLVELDEVSLRLSARGLPVANQVLARLV